MPDILHTHFLQQRNDAVVVCVNMSALNLALISNGHEVIVRKATSSTSISSGPTSPAFEPQP